ncbi:MAG TPA: class I SAM-dependent methyltransferase [Candidatus Tectomicrobia bacterium]|nr:class I SAM-dependent methyltransferase [Candidatus Tectomicrobia bacterium]
MGNAYDITTYGERMAEVYDQWPGLPQNTDAIVACLTRLAGGGPVLELGIGTGRIALPLARHGLLVHSVDASPAMVAQLRAKPGGEDIPVTIGNFADMAVEGRFTLIFVVFNTFFGLLSQDDQVRCFLGVAQHLADDGVFVLEAFVPDLGRYDRGQRVGAVGVETDRARLEVSLHDPVQQRVMSQHVMLSEQGIRLYPVQVRYAWPSELDLMARLAGLKLRDRWAGWAQEPFTATSGSHVSVYARAT